MYKKIGQTGLEIIKLLSITFALYFIFNIIVVKTLFFLLVDSPTINKTVLEMPDLRFNIIGIFFFLFVGWLITYSQQKITFINPWKLPKEELFSFFIISLFFSYYFSKSFSFFAAMSIASLVILTLFFLITLPQIATFVSSYGYKNLEQLKKIFVSALTPENLVNLSKNLLVLSLIFLLGGYSILMTVYTSKRQSNYEKIIKENLFITKISPQKTTYAYRVKLEGYNFGGIPDKRYRLFSTYGTVITDLWTDTKIEFIIPLHWKEGNVDLWIERPNRYDEKKSISSNVIKLNLLNRWDFFPTEYDNIHVRVIKRIMRNFYLGYWNNLRERLLIPF